MCRRNCNCNSNNWGNWSDSRCGNCGWNWSDSRSSEAFRDGFSQGYRAGFRSGRNNDSDDSCSCNSRCGCDNCG